MIISVKSIYLSFIVALFVCGKCSVALLILDSSVSSPFIPTCDDLILGIPTSSSSDPDGLFRNNTSSCSATCSWTSCSDYSACPTSSWPWHIYQLDNEGYPFSIISWYNLIGTLGCAFWFGAYIAIIYRSHKDKSYGMPMLCLCLNFSWELHASFVWDVPIPLWRAFYRGWLLFDVVIMYQLIQHGKREMRVPELKQYFYPLLCGTFAFSLWGLYAFQSTFNDPMGFGSAFLINLVMSIMFIFFYFEKRDLNGISSSAAWLKMLGTLCTASECYVLLPVFRPRFPSFTFLHFLYVSIFVIDCVYICLLRRRAQKT